MEKVHADEDYLNKYRRAEAHSFISAGGPTMQVVLGDEDYVILVKDKLSIDISLRSGIIRIYNSSRRWKVHAMDRDSQTTEMEVLSKS